MTTLLIRSLQEELYPDQEHFHIVGENALDSTGTLMFTSADQRFPDMINVQAINARALVQSIAYPAMSPRAAVYGRAQLLANFGRRGIGRFPRKYKLRGPCGVTCGDPVHFAGA